jgi:PleD family two-component response regulator
MTERFCAQAALALAHARLLAQARLHAGQDGLTGLANRRTFDAVLGAETATACRCDEPAARRHRPLQAAERRARPPVR